MNRVERVSAAWGPHSIRTTILLLGRREGEREREGGEGEGEGEERFASAVVLLSGSAGRSREAAGCEDRRRVAGWRAGGGLIFIVAAGGGRGAAFLL